MLAAVLDGASPELVWCHTEMEKEGKALHTPYGMVGRDDLLAFRGSDGAQQVGFVKKLFQHADGSYWCLLLLLDSLGGASFSKANGKDFLIPAEAVRDTFPYFYKGDHVCIVAPVDLFT